MLLNNGFDAFSLIFEYIFGFCKKHIYKGSMKEVMQGLKHDFQPLLGVNSTDTRPRLLSSSRAPLKPESKKFSINGAWTVHLSTGYALLNPLLELQKPETWVMHKPARAVSRHYWSQKWPMLGLCMSTQAVSGTEATQSALWMHQINHLRSTVGHYGLDPTYATLEQTSALYMDTVCLPKEASRKF